jgi:hypothetical protein
MINTFLKSLAFVFVTAAVGQCVGGSYDDPAPGPGTNPGTPLVPGIPLSGIATVAPTVPSPGNVSIPNFSSSTQRENGYDVVNLTFPGIQCPLNPANWMKFFGTNTRQQNIWLTIDGVPQAFSVFNIGDGETPYIEDKCHCSFIPEYANLMDIVFLVDNSTSMGQESEAIARDIIEWSNELSDKLNVQFGCVGFDDGVVGAIDLTDADELEDYLNRGSGITRTQGFGGANAATLSRLASSYLSQTGTPRITGGGPECGMAALHFASENFNWRSGATRVYINITDESNQHPSGDTYNCTAWLNSNWASNDGTIHVVWSGDVIGGLSRLTPTLPGWVVDHPEDMSTISGGTVLYAPYDWSGITLSSLPVSGVLLNSFVLSFVNLNPDVLDGRPHTVTITILNPDGTVYGEKTFTYTF